MTVAAYTQYLEKTFPDNAENVKNKDGCELCSDAQMFDEAQKEKCRYFREKLSSGKYTAMTFGMPRLIPVKEITSGTHRPGLRSGRLVRVLFRI